jgi:hypothetical protein
MAVTIRRSDGYLSSFKLSQTEATQSFATRRIRPVLLRVILRQTRMYNIEAMGQGDPICTLYVLDNVTDEVGKFEYGELVAVAQVDRSCLARVHQCDQTVD